MHLCHSVDTRKPVDKPKLADRSVRCLALLGGGLSGFGNQRGDFVWVRGHRLWGEHLRAEGWGAAMGFPGLDLDAQGDTIEGLVFSSTQLAAHWPALDAFKGDAYRRTLAAVRLASGETVEGVCTQKMIVQSS